MMSIFLACMTNPRFGVGVRFGKSPERGRSRLCEMGSPALGEENLGPTTMARRDGSGYATPRPLNHNTSRFVDFWEAPEIIERQFEKAVESFVLPARRLVHTSPRERLLRSVFSSWLSAQTRKLHDSPTHRVRQWQDP